MQTLTQQLLDQGLSDRFITDVQLSHLVTGSNQRRYHLVNRAIKTKELIRLKRGLYMLAKQFRCEPSHPFAIAQALVPGCYVSLESALAYHGWIPEAVLSTACIVPQRKSYDYHLKDIGNFTFQPLASHPGYFLEMIEYAHVNQQRFLVAKPLRALLDLICINKMEWQGIDFLTQGLRIEEDTLCSIQLQDIQVLQTVYKQKRIQHFLEQLGLSLNLSPPTQPHHQGNKQ